ncbi:MAG: DNA repair protein RadA [Patescibacteria group bacterium]
MAFYICSNCGYGSATFLGKCPECGEWNTLKQQQGFSDDSKKKKTNPQDLNVKSFEEVIAKHDKRRHPTGIHEFDRVLGGGIPSDGVILLTGEPGIGKSTLLLQALSKQNALYISGEESAEQIKERIDRLKMPHENLMFSDTLQVESIIEGFESLKSKPNVLVVDSIQMLYSRGVESMTGSVSQLRETILQLVQFAKKNHVALILIGHITKEGDVAGPKIVEHMVDTVLSFEGDKISHFRILRATKNRFGSTDEIGIFEMKGEGLSEVTNPLAFVSPGDNDASSDNTPTTGRAVAGVIEGKRPLFFEIQSLTVHTSLPVPRRVARGVEYNKLLLLLAVMKRHMRIDTDTYDIYVNVAGGVDVKSPASDLAILASLISSIKDKPIPKSAVFVGEVGLLGEVRSAYSEDKILAESKRIGLTKYVNSKNLKKHCRNLLSLFGS